MEGTIHQVPHYHCIRQGVTEIYSYCHLGNHNLFLNIFLLFWDFLLDWIAQMLLERLFFSFLHSTGHNAQYCSYSTMADSTKEIVSVVTLDKRETGRSSVIMEREAFIQTVEKLNTELKIMEFCTDAHVQIGALMSECFNPILISNCTVLKLLYLT